MERGLSLQGLALQCPGPSGEGQGERDSQEVSWISLAPALSQGERREEPPESDVMPSKPKESAATARLAPTDMIQQYQRIKAQYTDAILLFSFGDFYEMFFEYAEQVARELQLVLTSRP